MTETIRKIASIEDAMQSYHLTREQIDAATMMRAGDGSYFFTVKSATTPGVIYKIIYNPALKALQCVSFDGGPVCKASEGGYNCWHKRASQARAILIRLEQRLTRETEVAAALATRTPQEIEDQAEIQRLIGQGIDSDTATRVVLAKYKSGPSAKAVKRDEARFASREFRLLK